MDGRLMDDLINEAREAIELSYQYDRDNRREAMEDLRFTAGFQWSDADRAQRAGRPMITINRSGQFLRQVSNPIRQNMPIIKVETDNDDTSDLAEIANGMFRRIQYNSSASHVYANATEHMVACGIGWFRVVQDYINQESFDQELLIKRIFNPLSVYPDPSALEPDRSDMNWCIVSEMMPKKAFEARWKGKKADSIEAVSNSQSGSVVAWGSGDYVRVAEYWRRKEVMKTIAMLPSGEITEVTKEGEKQLRDLINAGFFVDARKVKSHTTEMTLVSGSEQLEEAYECPCKWIPIIPVIGAEIPLEQGVYRHGLIRFQREPQQLHNYFMSVAAESLGQQPKAPYMATAKQIGKYKSLWDNANKSPTPYLLYEPDPQVPGGVPQRVEPPPLPTALIQMAQMLSDDMKATTGIYDAALGARSNETSGVAIGQRVEQGQQATFHFVDNLEHSLEHLGRVLLDMIPKVYDNERTMRIKGEDDSEQEVTINKSLMKFGDTELKYNDITKMRFNSVRVVLGPSYASRRQEAVNQMVQLTSALPQVGIAGADIIVRNMDFEGAEELAERLKVSNPVVQQMEQMNQPQQADPMQEMQMQGAAEMMNIELEGAKAKTGQEQAKAAQEAAKVEGAQLDNALKVKKLREPPPRPGNGANAGQKSPAERRAF
jgi:hypothetical protein